MRSCCLVLFALLALARSDPSADRLASGSSEHAFEEQRALIGTLPRAYKARRGLWPASASDGDSDAKARGDVNANAVVNVGRRTDGDIESTQSYRDRGRVQERSQPYRDRYRQRGSGNVSMESMSSCAKYAGATCLFLPCRASRNAECLDSRCMCGTSKCAFNGACVRQFAGLGDDLARRSTENQLRNSSEDSKNAKANKTEDASTNSTGGDCGRPDVAAALASSAALDSELIVTPAVPSSDVDRAKKSLQSSGFRLEKEFRLLKKPCKHLFELKVVLDKDAAFLWRRNSDGHCLLAFRGSNCLEDSFWAIPWAHRKRIKKYGYEFNHDHLVNEFEPLLEKMAKADFESCATLDVTGHSMGGGLASIFAVLSNAGKLELGTTVTGLYAFGPIKVFYGAMPANEQREDGCFVGRVYCNHVRQGDLILQDQACFFLGPQYSQAKTNFVKIGAASGVTPCAQVSKGTLLTGRLTDLPATGLMPAHAPQNYITGLRCSDAVFPFDADRFCRAHPEWCYLL